MKNTVLNISNLYTFVRRIFIGRTKCYSYVKMLIAIFDEAIVEFISEINMFLLLLTNDFALVHG